MPTQDGRRRIAILGGGVGAVAAAFALTDGENAGRFDVTVYQIGWRLGGKGASGRNPAADRHGRIQEHGVHVWFGFYYNAVPTMRRCLAELERVTGESHRWEDYFTAHDSTVLEDYADGRWIHAPIEFPPGHPGRPPTPWEFARQALEWLLGRMVDLPELVHDPEHERRRSRFLGPLAGLGDRIAAWVGPQALLAEALRVAATLATDASQHLEQEHGQLLALIDACDQWVDDLLEPIVRQNDLARQLWMAIDLGFAAVRGMLRDGVVKGGFDVIDDQDIWPWLAKHGASPAHRDALFVRALYSQAFAFPHGDPERRSIGAGTTLRATMRMLFAYEERFMWKMNAGMGDVVFAPFYRVLRARGVKFRFFHRVRSLHPSSDGSRIERVVVGRQLRLRNGDAAEYEPLVSVPDPRVGRRWCWPSEPDLTQVDEAQAAAFRQLRQDPGAWVNLESYWSSWGPDREDVIELRAGEDFDAVVLGVSLGALEGICADLVAANPRWRAMVENLETTRTQAFQLWLRPTLRELGWASVDGPVSTAYVEPIDTWADMNQTLPAEPWPPGLRPGLIAYFCGVMADSPSEPPWFGDPGFPRAQHEAAYANMRDFLARHVRHLFPRGTDPANPDGLDLGLLVDPAGVPGEARLRAQHWIANIDPTERYVLSVPGSSRHRLPSDGSGFANLFLAGDWTRNAINAGCVEAALTSGMAASRGLSGFPRVIIGETDF
jgi:uncharacterized protein with NAD-binding domain and iron-sulfur cluster